ncbi:MAG: hypothetical protein RI958_1587 [Actinomycetota bacterium]
MPAPRPARCAVASALVPDEPRRSVVLPPSESSETGRTGDRLDRAPAAPTSLHRWSVRWWSARQPRYRTVSSRNLVHQPGAQPSLARCRGAKSPTSSDRPAPALHHLTRGDHDGPRQNRAAPRHQHDRPRREESLGHHRHTDDLRDGPPPSDRPPLARHRHMDDLRDDPPAYARHRHDHQPSVRPAAKQTPRLCARPRVHRARPPCAQGAPKNVRRQTNGGPRLGTRQTSARVDHVHRTVQHPSRPTIDCDVESSTTADHHHQPNPPDGAHATDRQHVGEMVDRTDGTNLVWT